MNLEKLGIKIKTKRLHLKISLNRMSEELYGNRYRVNHLSKIEQGKVNITFTQLMKIKKYLKLKIGI